MSHDMSGRSPVRWLRPAVLWALALAMLLVSIGADPARASLPRRPPSRLYTPPSPLPHERPGTIIRAVQLRSPRGWRQWVALYHSRSVSREGHRGLRHLRAPHGEPRRGVDGRSCPTGTARPDSPTFCAVPNRGQRIPLPLLGADRRWVRAGYAVAATDYEGLGTPGQLPYAVGISAGRSVLDAARAVRHLGHGTVGSRVVFEGHSEGGHAVLWADELARRYAPELRPQGVVASSPAADFSPSRGSPFRHRSRSSTRWRCSRRGMSSTARPSNAF